MQIQSATPTVAPGGEIQPRLHTGEAARPAQRRCGATVLTVSSPDGPPDHRSRSGRCVVTDGPLPTPIQPEAAPQPLRVLFVDDEPRLIEGLQRMLRPQRREWEMTFVATGEEALRLVAERHIDVVVTDMRMPGISGAEVLAEVMRLRPSTVRIVLSGHADQDMVRKTIGLAHQYLSKPCDADLLRSTITRACRLRSLLRDDRLRDLAGRLQTMPSLPTLYLRLVELMRDPTASLREVGALVASDLGMSVKVLQLVNSAFFGLPRQLSDPVEAVSLLGVEMIQSLALSCHAFSELEAGAGRIADADELWAQCMLVAKVARRIATTEGVSRTVADEAFMGGMLHQVGRLLLATNYGDDYSRLRRSIGASGIEADAAETAQFGATHAELGAYLLGLWGIADPIVEAVAFHRRPSACPASGFTPLAAVHAAHCLVDAGSRTAGRQPLDAGFLGRIGCLERLPAWREAYLSVARSRTE